MGNSIPQIKWYRTVRFRLFASFSALVVAFTVFTFFYIPQRLHHQALTGAKDEAQSFANFLAFTLIPAVNADDSLAARETIAASKQNERLRFVVVTGKMGTPLVAYGMEEATHAGYQNVSTGQASLDGELWMTSTKVMRQEVEVGQVHLGFSLAKMKADILESKRIIGLLCAVILILGIGFVYWITTLLTRHLTRIAQVANEVREGDFSQRAYVRSRDEVGILAASFNAMLDRLAANTNDLRKREAQFRMLAESMNEGLLQLGPDLKIRYLNPRLCAMLGYVEKDLVGKHLGILLGTQTLPDFDAPHSSRQMELQVRDAHGELRWILLSYSYQNVAAAEQSMTVIFTDITTLKQTERDLLYKNRELDTFVYKASHDLKAPLSSLRGLVDIAITENKAPEAAEYLGLIDRTVGKMDDVLQGLLEVTWIKQGALEYGEVSVRDLVQAILRSLEHVPSFQKISLRQSIPDHCILVTDMKLLSSILQNLIHNALKYHREEGEDRWVEVTVTETAKSMRFSIQDNGQGIPAHAQEKVFDMFFRASLKSKGSGLGLYIVKNSIEKLGGSIALSSEVGKGTEFVVELPKGELKSGNGELMAGTAHLKNL
jgi:PAS domain S-box-containing protein